MKQHLLRRRIAALLLAATALAPATFAAAAEPQAKPDASLHAALGGTDGIRQLMDHFVPRLKADPRLSSFFEKTNLPELARQLTDQICAISGGPCEYKGAPMKTAHADFEIRRADFNALVEVLQSSMDARGISFRDQNRLLARLAPMHREIVNTR